MRDTDPSRSSPQTQLVETYFSTRSTSLPTLVRYNAALTLFDTSIGAEGEAQEIGMSFRRKLAPKINFHADKTAHPGTYFVEAVVQEIDLLSTDEPTIKNSALVQHVTEELHRSSQHQLGDFSKWVSVHSETVDDPPACFGLLERELSDAVAIIERMFTGLEAPQAPPRVTASVVLEQLTEATRDVIDGRTHLSNAKCYQHPEIGLEHCGLIKLVLPRTLTDMNAFALLYVAAHEIGVHLFERILSHDRLATPLGWSFCEGFVDHAVYKATLRFLEEDEARSGAYLKGVRDRHTARPNEPQNKNEKPKGLWRRGLNDGRDGFDKLTALAEAAETTLPHVLLDKPPAQWAEQVAMVLNMLGLTDLQRAHLIAALDRIHARKDILAAILSAAEEAHPNASTSLPLGVLSLGRAVLEETNGIDFVSKFLDLAVANGVTAPRQVEE